MFETILNFDPRSLYALFILILPEACSTTALDRRVLLSSIDIVVFQSPTIF